MAEQLDVRDDVLQEPVLCRELDVVLVQELNRIGVLTEGDVRTVDECRSIEGVNSARCALIHCLKLAANRNGNVKKTFREVLQRKQNSLFRKLFPKTIGRTGCDVTVLSNCRSVDSRNCPGGERVAGKRSLSNT